MASQNGGGLAWKAVTVFLIIAAIVICYYFIPPKITANNVKTNRALQNVLGAGQGSFRERFVSVAKSHLKKSELLLDKNLQNKIKTDRIIIRHDEGVDPNQSNGPQVPQGNLRQENQVPQGNLGQENQVPQGNLGQENQVPRGNLGQENQVPQGNLGQENQVPQGNLGQEKLNLTTQVPGAGTSTVRTTTTRTGQPGVIHGAPDSGRGERGGLEKNMAQNNYTNSMRGQVNVVPTTRPNVITTIRTVPPTTIGARLRERITTDRSLPYQENEPRPIQGNVDGRNQPQLQQPQQLGSTQGNMGERSQSYQTGQMQSNIVGLNQPQQGLTDGPNQHNNAGINQPQQEYSSMQANQLQQPMQGGVNKPKEAELNQPEQIQQFGSPQSSVVGMNQPQHGLIQKNNVGINKPQQSQQVGSFQSNVNDLKPHQVQRNLVESYQAQEPQQGDPMQGNRFQQNNMIGMNEPQQPRQINTMQAGINQPQQPQQYGFQQRNMDANNQRPVQQAGSTERTNYPEQREQAAGMPGNVEGQNQPQNLQGNMGERN